MDLHSLTFQQLKQVAKNHVPKIKQYYIKPRIELIRLLTMEVLPESYKIEKMTIHELRDEARSRGHTKGIWRMLRTELIELLYPSSKQNNKDDDSGQKHDNPEKGDGEKVGV